MTPTPLLGRPARLPAHRPTAHRPRSRRARLVRLVALSAAALASVALSLALASCDSAPGTPGLGLPVALPPVSSDQQAIVTEAFEDVESLFALGFDDAAARSHSAVAFGRRDSARHHTPFPFESGDGPLLESDGGKGRTHTPFPFERRDSARSHTPFAFERHGGAQSHTPFASEGGKTRVNTPFPFERGASQATSPLGSSARVVSAHVALATVRGAALARIDTTTFTGVYDAANTKGYLVQLSYRQPQGVGVWSARVQHGRIVLQPGGRQLDAVETVALTFLDYGALERFVTALAAGTVPYLTGTSSNAEASFATYDTWRVAQVYSPAEGTAVVSYANANLRESLTVRDPVATRNANGTGTVRDGGPDGSVRTRFYGADFAVSATGVVSGTLLRTLYSAGDASDGSVISLTQFPDASFRQTRQRGGNGVVIRENTQG